MTEPQLEDFHRRILGFYSPGALAPSVVVGQDKGTDAEATLAHERTHELLFRTTTYGHVLNVLRHILEHRGRLSQVFIYYDV